MRHRDTPLSTGGQVQALETAPALLATLFFVICIPVVFSIAGILLSPTRLFLLAMIVPATLKVLGGQVGPVNRVDQLMIAFSLWIVIALMANHGLQRIPYAVITMVEVLGGYMLGRMLIRNAADFRLFFRMHFFIVIFLIPFAIVETITGRIIIASMLDTVFDAVNRGQSAYGRMGLERVYAVFDHPIHFGLFCSMALANLFMIHPGAFQRVKNTVIISFMTFLSLSSAPLLALVLQFGLLSWNWVMKGRWKLFVILAVSGYVIIDLLSDRTPVTILIETATFNPASGWVRIAIFEAGFAAVKGSPIFGIGMNDWPRPHWVTASVDNYWLLTAMRYGAVGFLFVAFAFAVQLYLVAAAPARNAEFQRYKTGYCIVLAATAFCLITVDLFGTMTTFVMFYVGAGAWFYCGNDPDSDEAAAGEDTASRPTSRYTRFPASPGMAATRSTQTPPPRSV